MMMMMVMMMMLVMMMGQGGTNMGQDEPSWPQDGA